MQQTKKNNVLLLMVIGYASFYLLRNNFSYIVPTLINTYGYDKILLGFIITSATAVYASCKGLNGVISDHVQPRYMFAMGLALSCICCLIMSISSNIYIIGFFWTLSSLFQSMGWPACAKLLVSIFDKQERATKWAITSMSMQIGGIISSTASGFIITELGWRFVFIIPAIFGILISALLAKNIGNIALNKYKSVSQKKNNIKTFFFNVHFYIISNPVILLLTLASFCFSLTRIGLIAWTPCFLQESCSLTPKLVGLCCAIIEIGTLVGGIGASYLSDKIFKGNRFPICIACTGCSAICIFLMIEVEQTVFHCMIMVVIGMLTQSTHILISVAISEYVPNNVSGTVLGTVTVIASIGPGISGILTGFVSSLYGWNAVFCLFSAFSLCTCVLFIIAQKRSKSY